MNRKLLIASLLLHLGLCAQNEDAATSTLNEVLVVDYHIKADQSFKERQIQTDSLALAGRLTLGEALRNNTGIFVKSYGGNGVATLSLRGTGASHTNVFWNNLEISSPMLGLADLSIIPLNAFDNLNLQYGFASLSAGSGALGGSLRMENNPKFQSGSQIQLQQMAGSFDRYQSSLKLNLGEGDFRSETQVYSYTAQNNFSYPDIAEAGSPEKSLKNSQYTQQGAIQNFYYRLSSRELLSLKAWYNHVDRKLPATLTGDPNNFDELEDHSLAAVAQYQRQNDQQSLLINSGIVKSDNIFTSVGDSSNTNNRFVSWQNNLRHRWQIAPELSVENGFRYKLESAHSKAYTEEVQRHHSSFFSQWSYDFTDNWGSRLLLREELINQQFSPLIGSLGFFYRPNDQNKIRVNVAHNFRFPTLNDLYWTPGGNLDLQPERSWNFETGYQYWLQKGSFRQDFDATVFYNLVDNWIQWVPLANYTSPVNLKKVVNAGIELEAKGSLRLGELTLTNRLTYSYTRSITTEVYGEGNAAGQLPYVPFHKFSGGLGLQHKSWGLRYTQNFTSRYFTTSGNDVYMPAYSLAEISLLQNNLLKSSKHQLKAAFTVHNLFDLPYQILPYRPEPGIHFSFQITYNTGI